MALGKKKVLFICTGNSCRSQMAEGLVNHDFGREIEAKSAGIMPGSVNPNSIKVMSEIGIDIRGQRSKHIDEFKSDKFDLVITLCDYAAANCPVWQNVGEQIHMPFEDPIVIQGSQEQILKEYRRVRDEMRKEIGLVLTDKLKGWVLDSGGHC